MAEPNTQTMTELAPLDGSALPIGVRSRFVPDINGLRVHILEAGLRPTVGRACSCCTGFRSWRIHGAR